MRTLTLVRHGQSLANIGGLTMENRHIPLTDRGHQQATLVAELLPSDPDEVLASPFERAIHTSEPYCRRVGVQPTLVHQLHEFDTIDPALLTGMTGEQRRPIAEAYWAEADPGKRMGPRAETFHEFALRVQWFRETLMPGLPRQVVAFGHGMWTAMMAWQVLGFPIESPAAMKAFRGFQLGLPMPNTAVYHFKEIAPDVWRLEVDAGALIQATLAPPPTGPN